ncbi:MAG: hypothetical protein ABIT37_11875 [Luteolibacter sp.]
MKCHYTLGFIFIGVFVAVSGTSRGAEPVDKTMENMPSPTVRDLWKMVFVDDRRDYDQMISALKRIIGVDGNSNDTLTAKFLIGRIEINRTEADALSSYEKARAAFEDLTKSDPKTWQGQYARMALLCLLQSEGKYALVISEGPKALAEIDWNLIGKDAPPDLADYTKMADKKEKLTPDLLKNLIANSYLELKEPKEAQNWILKIDDEEMKKELQQQLKSLDK